MGFIIGFIVGAISAAVAMYYLHKLPGPVL